MFSLSSFLPSCLHSLTHYIHLSNLFFPIPLSSLLFIFTFYLLPLSPLFLSYLPHFLFILLSSLRQQLLPPLLSLPFPLLFAPLISGYQGRGREKERGAYPTLGTNLPQTYLRPASFASLVKITLVKVQRLSTLPDSLTSAILWECEFWCRIFIYFFFACKFLFLLLLAFFNQ